VAREKQEKGISSLRSPSPQIKKNSNPNHKKGEKNRPLQQNHNSTTAWETGERASRIEKKTEEPEYKRGRESNKNIQYTPFNFI